MAGELCFRLVDLQRYHELLPCLDELAGTRRLGEASAAAVQLALAHREHRPNGVEVLERIVRNLPLEPRSFLSPHALNEGITALVELLSFEDQGTWSLTPRVGPSWVVLESSMRVMSDQPWLEDIAVERWSGATALAYPRGETTSFLLTHAGLEDLLVGLRAVSRKPDLDRHGRGEVAGLIALASRAQSDQRWSLAYASLL
jgi:hypothetical protein